MITLGGIIYRLDLDKLDSLITAKSSGAKDAGIEKEVTTNYNEENKPVSSVVSETTINKGKEIDMVKYDTLGLLLQVIMSYEEDVDDSLGAERVLNNTPINYRIAFNTLLNYGVLIAEE